MIENLGILQKCKRFAGTSGGAIISAFLAIGMDAKGIKDIISLPFNVLINGMVLYCFNCIKRFISRSLIIIRLLLGYYHKVLIIQSKIILFLLLCMNNHKICQFAFNYCYSKLRSCNLTYTSKV